MFLRVCTSQIPNIQLEEMGPSMDLVIRRTSFAATDLWKASIKKPRVAETRKTKNISENEFGDKVGRIHLGRQDLSSMKVRRVKALRATSKRPRETEDGEDDTAGDDSAGGGNDGQHREIGEEGVATAAAKAKRGTRRKNKERKVL
ncbi:unnamed protein product [Sphacelaria rigidula]